jgi:hypothetical protein
MHGRMDAWACMDGCMARRGVPASNACPVAPVGDHARGGGGLPREGEPGPVQKYGVKSFPTIKLFSSDKIRNPYTRVLDKDMTDYKGGRDTKGLMEAAGSC